MRRFGLGLSVVVLGTFVGCEDDGSTIDDLDTTPIANLDEREIAALCADGTEFYAELLGDDSFQRDTCRLAALFQTSFGTVFVPDVSNEQLRETCFAAYTQCLEVAGSQPFEAAECGLPEDVANCSATVGEYEACRGDGVAWLRDIARDTPDCDSLTLATFDAGTTPQMMTSPASCVAFQAKCRAGVAGDVKTFIDAYCGLLTPCCSAAGLPTQCSLQVDAVAREETFDARAAASCLAALEARRAEPDFCDLAPSPFSASVSNFPAAIAECQGVFHPVGSVLASGICNTSIDCASAPDGAELICVSSGTAFPASVCTPTLDVGLGEACMGTRGSQIGAAFSAASSDAIRFCNFDAGLFCSDDSGTCTERLATGEKCTSSFDCVEGAFCDFTIGSCAQRRGEGSACDASRNECALDTFCDEVSGSCSKFGGAGAPCSVQEFPSRCLSGTCNADRCSHPLTSVCGT